MAQEGPSRRRTDGRQRHGFELARRGVLGDEAVEIIKVLQRLRELSRAGAKLAVFAIELVQRPLDLGVGNARGNLGERVIGHGQMASGGK
jgi:hypothetical protein